MPDLSKYLMFPYVVSAVQGKGRRRTLMIGVFEGMVRQNPQRTCFTFVDKEGNVEAFS